MELLLEWAVQPLSAVLLLWLASLVTLASGARCSGLGRTGRVALAANALAFAALWALATPLVANALLRPLERARTGPAGCEGWPVTALVVPGADMDAWSTETDPWRVLGPDTLARTLAAATLAGRFPDATLYALGGGDNGRALGPLMREVLAARGVDARRVRAEADSRSTRDNALALRALLPPAPPTPSGNPAPTEGSRAPGPTRIRLVTSALHLARATGSFERAGYAVCGTGVASLVSPSAGPPGMMPWTRSLVRSGEALRERLATIAYAGHASPTAPPARP